MLYRHLRQKQPAPATLYDHKAVPADFDLLRFDRVQWRQNTDLYEQFR
jgi:hypothetical protein